MKYFLLGLITLIIFSCNVQPTAVEQEKIEPIHPLPTKNQLEWHKMEYYAFVHFNMNTFTGNEWGHGDETPNTFNPTDLDCDQWAKTAKEAGMKGIILTAKHHDGFCLWPSKYTKHSVKYSAWRDGKGDVLKDLSEACKKHGIKMGIYVSPWDQHEQTYGTDEYNDFFVNQLTEVLTNYGDVFEVWFDGACGEGPNGKKQVYDWDRYIETIRKLQPNAVIFGGHGDIRWVGNESGIGSETNWCMFKNGFDGDLAAELPRGSENGEKWKPSEVDVSIRPSWYYQPEDSHRLRTLNNVVKIYHESVGRNSSLLLNFPINREGKIANDEVDRVKEMKNYLDAVYAENLNTVSSLSDKNLETFEIVKKGYEVDLGSTKFVNAIILQEPIQYGQRIKKFNILAIVNGTYKIIYEGETIGNKRILNFPTVETQRIKLEVLESRAKPLIAEFEIYTGAPTLEFSPINHSTFKDDITVSIKADMPNVDIFYAINGGEKQQYSEPFKLDEESTIIAYGIDAKRNVKSLDKSATYHYAKYNKVAHYLTEFSEKYTGGGGNGLVDYLKGSENIRDGHWQGFEGKNMEVVIELEEVKEVSKIKTRYVHLENSWVFSPKKVTYFVSEDNKNFTRVYEQDSDLYGTTNVNRNGVIYPEYEAKIEGKKAKYIKVVAESIKECPDYHVGKGNPAWLFCDEVEVE